jgi:hypothetical protein
MYKHRMGHMMDNWSEMRRNFEAYADFYTYIVKAIVGKRNFKKRLRTMAKGAEVVTISDEALALIGVENGRRVWDDFFHLSEGKIRQIRNDETYLPEWRSDILPQYTRASKDDPSVERNTENKCWNEAGIVKFNKLRQLVKADRLTYPDFKIKWLCHTRDNMKKTDGINVEEDASSKIIEADDDLHEGAATYPVLKEAKQQEGVASGDETDEEDEGDGAELE